MLYAWRAAPCSAFRSYNPSSTDCCCLVWPMLQNGTILSIFSLPNPTKNSTKPNLRTEGQTANCKVKQHSTFVYSYSSKHATRNRSRQPEVVGSRRRNNTRRVKLRAAIAQPLIDTHHSPMGRTVSHNPQATTHPHTRKRRLQPKRHSIY